MARPKLYPDGVAKLGISVPPAVKDGLQEAAIDQGQSISQLVTVVIEDWLRRRGYLREREGVAV